MHSNRWSKLKKEFLFKKQGAVVLPLKEHQQRIVNKISNPNQPGLVLAHNLGSGKTLSSIAAIKRLNLPTNVITPASLIGNYNKELQKWLGDVPENVNIQSQQGIARNGIQNNPKGLTIIDEAHKARDQDSALLAALKNHIAAKKLLLTATPAYNHPRDIAPLVNIAAGKQILPEDKAEFENKYVDYKKVEPDIFHKFLGIKPGVVPELKNKKELKNILKKWVDYYPKSEEGYPRSSYEEIKVPISKTQDDIYKAIMGKAPWWLKYKVKAGLPPGKGELEAMRAFLTGARQVSNTSKGFVKRKSDEHSTKIDKAFKFFQKNLEKDPNYKAIIYSNYLQSGLSPYKERLINSGIPFGEFSGDISQKDRNQIVKDYNNNKLKALLISSAGAEGLDTKNTRLVQLLESHYNEEKEKQIIGRAIRYLSHASLPPDKQHVLVQRYLAQPRGNFIDRLFGNSVTRGADEYIRDIALQKSKLNDQFISLMDSLNK